MRNNPTLPPYRLAIFEETAEQKAERERNEAAAAAQRDADAQAQRQRDADAQAQRQRDADAAAAKKKTDDEAAAAAKKKADDEAAARNGRGQFESQAEYERRIGELNEENKTRRQENRDLKGTVSVLERRTIRADAVVAVRTAGALSDRIVDLFLNDMADDIKIDPKTGETKGLEKIAEFKKANPEFFKPDETAEQKTAREAVEKKAADEKAAAEKRGNRSAAGGSRGAGSGNGEGDTGGLPDLSTLKTAAERKKALDDYKRSLRTSNGSGGYAKASSRH